MPEVRVGRPAVPVEAGESPIALARHIRAPSDTRSAGGPRERRSRGKRPRGCSVRSGLSGLQYVPHHGALLLEARHPDLIIQSPGVFLRYGIDILHSRKPLVNSRPLISRINLY